MHGPVFVNPKGPAQHAVAALREKQGAGRINPLEQPDQQAGERQDQKDHRHRHRQIQGPFHQPVQGVFQRLLPQADEPDPVIVKNDGVVVEVSVQIVQHHQPDGRVLAQLGEVS